MPTWLDLDENALWQQIGMLDASCAYEDDPVSDWERERGLRFFRKGVYQWRAKDLASGTIGSGELPGEAVADLRRKMSARKVG